MYHIKKRKKKGERFVISQLIKSSGDALAPPSPSFEASLVATHTFFHDVDAKQHNVSVFFFNYAACDVTAK